ncbi:uncharacterized protein [Arachis hypogaea]|uniref:uncharacterized protein isoform X2 n=1 Tax=Arachis hypogaea TaxID=3818 RepID=UPI003B21A7E1
MSFIQFTSIQSFHPIETCYAIFLDLCDPLAHLQFWRGSSALKKKSYRLKVFQENALSMSSASSNEGTAPQANGITRRLSNSAKEVQALAKEAAEIVVLVIDEEGVESLILELVKGVNEPKLLWSSHKNYFLVL